MLNLWIDQLGMFHRKVLDDKFRRLEQFRTLFTPVFTRFFLFDHWCTNLFRLTKTTTQKSSVSLTPLTINSTPKNRTRKRVANQSDPDSLFRITSAIFSHIDVLE